MHVRATVSDSGLVLKDIEKGRATLGLVGQKTENPNLEYRTIGSDCLVLIVHAKHPSVGRKTVSLRALKSERLIIREPGSGSRCALERASRGPARRSRPSMSPSSSAATRPSRMP